MQEFFKVVWTFDMPPPSNGRVFQLEHTPPPAAWVLSLESVGFFTGFEIPTDPMAGGGQPLFLCSIYIQFFCWFWHLTRLEGSPVSSVFTCQRPLRTPSACSWFDIYAENILSQCVAHISVFAVVTLDERRA